MDLDMERRVKYRLSQRWQSIEAPPWSCIASRNKIEGLSQTGIAVVEVTR
eukprot:m.116483 g.116483  ORF g.116483 m.116483 type:complete len:50 (-) comp15519_c0_seq1:219-368(-)